MESTFLARKVYKDGYQLDGYEVMEFVDGYQIDSRIMNLGDAARLERNLEKMSTIVRRSEQEHSVPTVFRPISAPMPLPLYRAFLERAHGFPNQENIARLTGLRDRYAALYAAISSADGYGE